MDVSKNNLDQAIAAAREAHSEYAANPHVRGCADACAYTLRDLLAALDAQPIAGEVWQYRANSTSRGKEWIDCRDEQIARQMEALGFEIRCLYAAPPAAVPEGEVPASLWTDEQCREFCRVAFRHRHQPGLPTQTTLDDIRYGAHFAMLAAADKENTND